MQAVEGFEAGLIEKKTVSSLFRQLVAFSFGGEGGGGGWGGVECQPLSLPLNPITLHKS